MDAVQQHFRISELHKLLRLKFYEDMHLNSSSQSCFTHLSLICFSTVASAKTQNKHMVRTSKNTFIHFLSITRLSEINASLNPLTEGICHITYRWLKFNLKFLWFLTFKPHLTKSYTTVTWARFSVLLRIYKVILNEIIGDFKHSLIQIYFLYKKIYLSKNISLYINLQSYNTVFYQQYMHLS